MSIRGLDHYLTTPPEEYETQCYDCGKPESQNTGGLNDHETEDETLALCDECLRQREYDEEVA